MFVVFYRSKSGTTLHGGDGRGKVLFLLLKSVKRHKGPLVSQLILTPIVDSCRQGPPRTARVVKSTPLSVPQIIVYFYFHCCFLPIYLYPPSCHEDELQRVILTHNFTVTHHLNLKSKNSSHSNFCCKGGGSEPGGHSLTWSERVCAAEEGLVFGD